MPPSRSLTRSISRTVRACGLALLALGLLAPATAGAAHCGRYVTSETRFGADLARLLAADTGSDAAPAMPLPPASPCKGAFCEAPPAAPAAPVAPATAPGEQGLPLPGRPTIPAAASRLDEPDDARLSPVDLGLAVFHPPRPA